MKEEKITMQVPKSGEVFVRVGEIPESLFTDNTALLQDGEMYLCRCEISNPLLRTSDESFYQLIPCIDGRLSTLAGTYEIISFALLP